MDQVFKILSLLTEYPAEELVAGRVELAGAVEKLPPGGVRRFLQDFLGYWYATSPGELQALYIQTFDLAVGTSLHLTYHRFGDGRERGTALLRLKERLREAGWDLAAAELPDYLPLVLELACVSPVGLDLISEYRAPLEVIRLRLEGDHNPYAPLFAAIAAALPPLTENQREEVAALRREKAPGKRRAGRPTGPAAPMERASRKG